MYNYRIQSLVLNGLAEIQKGQKRVSANCRGQFLRLYKKW